MSYGQYSDNYRGKTNPLRHESKPKRQVFPTSEIPHLWFHKTQQNARNAQGNLFFVDDTIYSYGNHFPIARHVTVGRKTAVLLNSGSYSVTTAQQQSAVRQAIAKGTTVFSVPNLNSELYTLDHTANLLHFANEAKRLLKQAENSRKYGMSTMTEALAMKFKAKEYAKFFKQKMPDFSFMPTAKQLQALKAKLAERLARAKELDKTKDAREQARRIERQRLNALKLEDKITEWRNGASIRFYGESVPTMLRIEGDEVVTSLGARVPKDHAIRALRFVRACVAANREYVRNGHTEHVGNYSIDRIESNGTLHAGCHVISYEEIERFAKLLETE